MAGASIVESSNSVAEDHALPPAPGDESRQVFRREGEYWTVDFGGLVCRLKHTRGMQHLAALLAKPGERVRALELVGATHGDDSGDDPARQAQGKLSTTLDAERARVNVTRHIGSVIKRIAEHHPALERHLLTTIRTGAACSYTPDARLAIRWDL